MENKNINNMYDDKDIQSFLLTKNIVWDGNITKRIGRVIEAEVFIKEINNKKDVILEVSPCIFAIDEKVYECYYDDTDISIYEYANFSDDWIRFLIKKDPENGLIISEYAFDAMCKAKAEHEDRIQDLRQQTRQENVRFEEFMKPWRRVIEVATAEVEKSISKKETEPENA